MAYTGFLHSFWTRVSELATVHTTDTGRIIAATFTREVDAKGCVEYAFNEECFGDALKHVNVDLERRGRVVHFLWKD